MIIIILLRHSHDEEQKSKKFVGIKEKEIREKGRD